MNPEPNSEFFAFLQDKTRKFPLSRQRLQAIMDKAHEYVYLCFYEHHFSFLQSADLVSSDVEQFIRSSNIPEYKLPGLYVIDALIREPQVFFIPLCFAYVFNRSDRTLKRSLNLESLILSLLQ